MVFYNCNPNIWRVRQKGLEFNVSLGYTETIVSKINQTQEILTFLLLPQKHLTFDQKLLLYSLAVCVCMYAETYNIYIHTYIHTFFLEGVNFFEILSHNISLAGLELAIQIDQAALKLTNLHLHLFSMLELKAYVITHSHKYVILNLDSVYERRYTIIIWVAISFPSFLSCDSGTWTRLLSMLGKHSTTKVHHSNVSTGRLPGDSSFLLLSFAEAALIALGADSPPASACPGLLGSAPSTGFSLSSFCPIKNNRSKKKEEQQQKFLSQLNHKKLSPVVLFVCSFEKGSLIAQASLHLVIVLKMLFSFWSSHLSHVLQLQVSPHLVCCIGTEPRASYMTGKYSINWTVSPICIWDALHCPIQ